MITQKELFAAVRALGLAITVQDGEYRITLRADVQPDSARREAVACYTDDREDALATARALAAHYGVAP